MVTVQAIADFFETRVPSALKLDFDNVGFLVGRSEASVSKVLVSLDITEPVIEEAAGAKAELILSHHPVIFGSIRSVTDADLTGRKLLALAEKKIAAICLHTNLDAAEGGVNDALMSALGGTVTGKLNPEEPISRLGVLPEPMDVSDFLAQIQKNLNVSGMRYYNAGRPVHRLACCGGSGGGDLELAVRAGCDTFVTADVKYDQFLAAKAWGINLVDADHFCTENVVVPVLANMVSGAFPELEVKISACHGQTSGGYTGVHDI